MALIPKFIKCPYFAGMNGGVLLFEISQNSDDLILNHCFKWIWRPSEISADTSEFFII